MFLLPLSLRSHAQLTEDVKAKLALINQKVVNTSCSSGKGLLISERAMNLLLSDKIGSYLSQFNDLSFYKNNVTFDAGDGTFSLNHNLFQATGEDTSIRTFLVVGARANVSNAFAAAFANKPFQNRLGVTVKKTWLGKPRTYFDCLQKQEMDAERAILLQSLLTDLDRKAVEFERNLASIKSSDIPGQNIQAVKDSLRKKFGSEILDEYNKRFTVSQSQTLINRSAYKKITLSWTSISFYLPVIRQQFLVAKSLTQNSERKYSYPVELALYHTKLYEWGNKGRLFLGIAGTVLQNNSVQASLLNETNNVFSGEYRNFFTPSIKGQAIYFPPDSHIGLSGQIEQNFGEYNVLNAFVGIPIVLIDKETAPAATFHFQVRYFDISNQVMPSKSWKDKLSVGMTLGVPFSKIIY